MSGLDFLFEGKPPPSVTTYGSSTTGMPRWMSDYTQGLITRANAIAAEPYQAYQGPRQAGLNEDQNRAFDITRSATGMYTPWINNAQQNAQGALGAAQPYMNAAARTYPQAASEYMDPYQENVINRAATLTNRTLNEKFLPQVANYFGANGATPRSTQMRATVDRGVRDLTEGLHEQSLGALSQGYQTGANIFASDANRQGALGQTAGQLSIESGRAGADIARTGQDLTLRDAAANAAVGETIQGDQQRSLDLAYEDFARQRDYPRQNVDWMSSVMQGTPRDTVQTNQSNGPANIYQPSPIAQAGSLATGVAALYDIFKKARGGRINAPRGALAYA